VRDYPGNYTQYRTETAKSQKEHSEKKSFTSNEPIQKENKEIQSLAPSVKISYKEKREWEIIEQELEKLQKEKSTLEAQLQTAVDFNELQQLAARLGDIMKNLDEKEMRWLELSEKFQA
jgi:ATP-binding cassette subfamily F protein uup